MLRGVPAHIGVPESYQNLAHAVASVSERIFTNEQPMVFSLPLKNFSVVSSDLGDHDNYYPEYKAVTIPHDSLCNTNNSAFQIIMPT